MTNAALQRLWTPEETTISTFESDVDLNWVVKRNSDGRGRRRGKKNEPVDVFTASSYRMAEARAQPSVEAHTRTLNCNFTVSDAGWPTVSRFSVPSMLSRA